MYFLCRTPTKHSTNVDTAVPVVPVPAVVTRPPIASSSTEPNATSKNSSVRLLINSNSDTLMPVQQQFTFFSNARLQMNDHTADRPIVINSTVTSIKKSDSDAKSATGESNATHFNPIIINQPKVSPQIMPLVQNTDMKNFNRFGSNLPTIIPNANSNARLVSIDTSNHPSPNLLTTLRPGKRDTPSSFPTVQVCSSCNQTTTESVTTVNSSGGASFLKPSSLLSHSTVPSTESSQTASLISVVPVDPSRSNLQPSTTTITSAQRFPIAVAPNRPNATGILINRPTTISRHPIVAPVSPLNSSTLNPNRKRARKQQLLAPQGTEAANSSTPSGQSVVSFVEMSSGSSTIEKSKVLSTSTVSSTPNIEAALHAANSLPIVNVASSSGVAAGSATQVMNVRLFPLRSCAGGKEGAGGSHFEQVSYSTTPVNSSQFHSLVVSSASVNAGSEGSNAVVQSTTTSSTASPPASLVTASSFPSSPSTGQTSMYVFPSSTTVQMPSLRSNTATATTTNPASSSGSSNILQVRFRPPAAVTRSPLTNAFIQQQTVRTVLSPSVANISSTGAVQPSPPASGQRVDWNTSTGMKSTAATINVEEIARKESAKPATPLDAGAQPALPIVRVPDPNSRNSSVAPQQPQQQLKRPRKQSNSASGIKKQCTWELLTDPLDSSKSVWRSPHQLQQEPPPSQQQSASRTATAFVDPESSLKIEALDPDSTIRGLPKRMHLFKSKADQDQGQKRGQISCGASGSGFYKGSKAHHFLRFTELKFRSLESGRTPPLTNSAVNRNETSSDMRSRRLCDTAGAASGQSFSDSEDVQTIRDILDSRSLQDEFKYVNNPVDTTSTLDLTCWRLHLCLRNCEAMMINEGAKFEKLTSALDRAFPRNRVETAACPEVPRLLCNSLTDQAQNLLTEIFLQAIPPASPSVLPKDVLNPFDEDEKKTSVIDTRAVEERTRALVQRVKTLLDGMQRIKDLSNELLTDHADFVQSFVEQIEYLRQNGSNPPPSSLSPNNSSPNADDQDFNGDNSNPSQDDDDLLTSPHPPTSKHLRSPSTSQKGTSPARATTFSNGRRR
ncbi:unnamed protein product [Hymenolepis diminuta]|uniref:Uncharacterized protein n=1 Tax=Hymenolepis diminuta TaxID=6216 RepID=A0A3P6WN70_HYMDI|nr:unnamed protein product [Hymenolepis diminuta]